MMNKQHKLQSHEATNESLAGISEDRRDIFDIRRRIMNIYLRVEEVR